MTAIVEQARAGDATLLKPVPEAGEVLGDAAASSSRPSSPTTS